MSDGEQQVFRAFVAAPIPRRIQEILAQVQADLKEARASVGWVRPENIHLTLAFLGDVPSGRAMELGAGLDDIGGRTAPFVCRLAGIGSFGGARPKVIWAGVGDGAAQAIALQADVAALLGRACFALEERDFRPHLTIGRVRSSRGARELMAALQRFTNRPSEEMRVDRVLLMRSDLSSQGPRYTVVHESRLAGIPPGVASF